MHVYLNKISGIDDAIVSMFISKRSWTRNMEEHIYRVCRLVLDPRGKLLSQDEHPELQAEFDQFNDWLGKLVKWGWMHIPTPSGLITALFVPAPGCPRSPMKCPIIIRIKFCPLIWPCPRWE